MDKKTGRIKKGEHLSPSTEFKKGEHWRPHAIFREKDYLTREYVEKKRSAADIASEHGVTESAIFFWLNKNGIKRRSISQARDVKHWGAVGKDNPMYGRIGILNPNWKGGFTPFRQQIYSSSEWKKFSRAIKKRDQICRLCGGKEQLEIHHIDPVSQSPLLVMDIGNAILLCAKCHRKMLGKEKRWRKKLLSLIEKGGDK